MSNKNVKEVFSFHFKRLRERKGLTQKEVAERLIIAPQSVSKWERGECLPSLEFLPDIAKILSCEIGELFMEIPENEETMLKADEILSAIEWMDRYEEAEEGERSALLKKHNEALLIIVRLEHEIFSPFPLDVPFLARHIQGTEKQSETILQWFVKKGEMDRHEDKYYFKNCKYISKISQLVAKSNP